LSPGSITVTGDALSGCSAPALDDVSVQLLDPCVDQRWAAFVERAPGGSIFHHPRWLALLARQYRYKMLACCIADRDARLCAGLPLALISSPLTGRRLAALPFSDVCTPLSEDGRDRGLAQALGGLCESMRVGLRVHSPLVGAPRVGAPYHHHLVKLEPDVEAVVDGAPAQAGVRGLRARDHVELGDQ